MKQNKPNQTKTQQNKTERRVLESADTSMFQTLLGGVS